MGLAIGCRACNRGAQTWTIHPLWTMPIGPESTMYGSMAASSDGFSRTSGFRLLVVIIIAGMGIPALFRWKAYDLELSLIHI